MRGAVGPVDAHVSAFAGFGNHLPAASSEFLLHHGRPLVGADEDARFFGADFTQDAVLLRQPRNHLALGVLLNHHGAVTHLDSLEPEVVYKAEVVVKLVADEVGFEQGAPRVDHEACVVVEFDLFLDVGSDNRSAKAQFQEVHFVGVDFEKVFGLPQAEAFIHDHGQARFAGLGGALRQVREVVVHRSGFHLCVPAGHTRVVEQTWVGLQQPIHAFEVRHQQVVKKAKGFSIQAQGEQAHKLFVPQRG